MSGSEALLKSIEEALGLLQDRPPPPARQALVAQPLSSLLEKCQHTSAEIAARAPEPIRTIHHFACTGGTLFSKCLAVMPNTQLLSEVDPLSSLLKLEFAPSDLILHMRHSQRPVPEDVLIEMFLSSLRTVYEHATRTGSRLVLRDHTHSHFCVGSGIPERPTVREIVARDFATLSAVTIRHPLDSFLTLRFLSQTGGWMHFDPKTLEEYCKRYMVFLDFYEDTPVFRYESLATDPETELGKLCDTLELPYTDGFADYLSVFGLTGNSGRAGLVIKPRPRREIPEAVAEERQSSPTYAALCARLDYAP